MTTQAPGLKDVPPVPTPSRAGLRCIGAGCEVLVIHARICDACMTSAAVALCWRFEAELISCGFEPGSGELKAALAGTPSSRSILWYESNSDLGAIGCREAEELRKATDIACFLVALGGVKALAHMPGRPTFRSAVSAWAHHEEPATPQIVPRIDATRDGAAEMAKVFGAQPRTKLGVWEKPENRFDAYTFAVFALVIFLLFHL